MLLVTVLAVAMLVTPVMAVPTQGQKVAVTFRFIFPPISQTIYEQWQSNGVTHTHFEVNFNVELTVVDGPILLGTASIQRKNVVVFPKGLETGKVNLVDYYVFDFGDGGFEGNGKVMLDEFNPAATPPWGDVRGQGLFPWRKTIKLVRI